MTSAERDQELSLLAHLVELRKRLTVSAIAVAVTSAVSFTFAEQLVRFLLVPSGVAQCTTLAPTENFATFMRVSLFAGDTFLLEETYRGTAAGDRDYTSRGGWATLADAKDPAAGRILMLSPRVGQTRRFRMLGDSALRELDGSGRELAPGPIRVLYREP